MLKFLTKHYLWITILLLGVAILLDLSYDTVNTVKTQMTATNSLGQEVTYEILTLDNYYQFIRAIVNILYSLGVSLIILVAIDKRIDIEESTQHKKELEDLNDKIHNNIFDGVLNKFVPEKLFDQVKKDIFKTDIIRKNARWTYNIVPNQYNSFTLTQTIQYEIENLTDGKIEKCLPVNIKFSSVLVDTRITHWKLKKINGDIEKEENTDFSTLNVTLDCRETKKVELNIINEYKTEAIMDNHISNFSIIGLDIQIQKPENVNVRLMPSFSTEIRINQPNEQLIMIETIPCILLGQGINYIIEKNNVA